VVNDDADEVTFALSDGVRDNEVLVLVVLVLVVVVVGVVVGLVLLPSRGVRGVEGVAELGVGVVSSGVVDAERESVEIDDDEASESCREGSGVTPMRPLS